MFIPVIPVCLFMFSTEESETLFTAIYYMKWTIRIGQIEIKVAFTATFLIEYGNRHHISIFFSSHK